MKERYGLERVHTRNMHCNSRLASFIINQHFIILFFFFFFYNKTKQKEKEKIPLFLNRQMRKVKKTELIMHFLGPQRASEQCPLEGPPTPCIQSFFWTKDTAFFQTHVCNSPASQYTQ